MGAFRRLIRGLKLGPLLFLLLLVSGIVPLLVGNLLLTRQNREFFETQEKVAFTRSAGALSRELGWYVQSTRRQLADLGDGLLAPPGAATPAERLQTEWVGPRLELFLRANPHLRALRVLDSSGEGVRLSLGTLDPSLEAAMDEAFAEASAGGRTSYKFVALQDGRTPMLALATPTPATGDPTLVVETIATLDLLSALASGEAGGEVGVLLLDREGRTLWAAGAAPPLQSAVAGSAMVRDYVRQPINLTTEVEVTVGSRSQRMLARLSSLDETGWAVVVHQPAAAAFRDVRRMAWNVALASFLLVAFALGFAAFAARRFSLPIRRLAESSHDIAAGNFSRRVEVEGPGLELANLAHDFNRMGSQIQAYVGELQKAASANRELFINSIRAFAAAIDAKDPYTRGHSERVAAFSRTIARHLTLPEETLTRAWISGVLHDVGKIGVEDRILKKGGVLTSEEYELMKAHPTIGADILAPIEQLREMLPAVRWHHESWNGNGYPDGLRGEQIPLLARIVAVADTFDAITTNRPYQRAYAPAFAVETITKLAGSRFDAKIVTAFLRAFQAGEIETRQTPVEPVVAGAR
jgi:HD-GYP domain-containing protein (c-di-GMP phosphodiesterase class II)